MRVIRGKPLVIKLWDRTWQLRQAGKFSVYCVAILGTTQLLVTPNASALPIGFGINQGDKDYSEIRSNNFIVYHDSRVPSEGALTLNALEAARPLLERWLGQQRTRPLPVIMSAVTENASFANFITDAIEIQTGGQAYKELPWHEYTHSTMYRAFDNILGPAGNIIHLPWMPAWFLEGLAESTSISVGSDSTAGIERYQALTGDWPSFDRLHSLYSNEGFSERGYATSGAMVSYLLRHADANRLPELLADFYHYTLPWWWPWAAVPFNGFMPMDKALEHFVNLNEKQFYATYKEDAKAFWESWSTAPLLVTKDKDKKPAPNRKSFASLVGLRSDGKDILHLVRIKDDLYDVALHFDPKTGWADNWQKRQLIPSDFGSVAGFKSDLLWGRVKYNRDYWEISSTIYVNLNRNQAKAKATPKNAQGVQAQQLDRAGTVFGLWQTPSHVSWLEQHLATTRYCEVPLSGGLPDCPFIQTVPNKLRVLGTQKTQPGVDVTATLWFVESEEKLTGTIYHTFAYDTAQRKVIRTLAPSQARPLSVAFAGKSTWLLVAERNERTLRRLDATGNCAGLLRFKDHILDVQGLESGDLVLGLYGGSDSYILKLPPSLIKETQCTPELGPTSPLQYALSQNEAPATMDMRTAMQGASLWTKPLTADDAALVDATEKEVEVRPPLDKDAQAGTGSEKVSTPAHRRFHPIFLFPWLGADDALGLQLGVVSVPLVDQMQNETVRATFLVGVASRFPYSEVALTSTRFAPTLDLALYREQTYNGVLRDRYTNLDSVSYYDERGGRLSSLLSQNDFGGTVNLGVGVKYANLKPYMGINRVVQGNLIEPTASLSVAHTVSRLTIAEAASVRAAPAALNPNFDYNQVGLSENIDVNLPFFASKMNLGVEGSRTRGPKRFALQEIYMPLKTFIPGSGGGYNQNSFPFTSTDLGLFTPRFGENQARAKASWTTPIISDIDKWVWLVYAERLDFTAFYNYGGAWRGAEPPGGWDHLIRAHGYKVDLQLENKGVRFNVGSGVGQVIGHPFEIYLTTGFDALF